MHRNGEFLNCYYNIFDKYPDLVAVSSTINSPFGQFGHIASDDEVLDHLDETVVQWYGSLGLSPDSVSTIIQVHGNSIFFSQIPGENGTYDGQLTNLKNNYLRVITADCLPVFLYDPENSAIGLVHAGWRGLVKKISSRAIEEMNNRFGTNPEDILSAVGPFNQKCCYEIDQDVADKFDSKFQTKGKSGKFLLDMGEVIRNELEENGISHGNIEVSKECTYCSPDKYFSARRSKFKVRNFHILGIKG